MKAFPLVDSEMRVTLETPDGDTYVGTVHMADIVYRQERHPTEILGEHTRYMAGVTSWEMRLIGSDFLSLEKREEIVKRITTPSKEWRCDFCGAIHEAQIRQCSQCGAWRSFIYEL